MKQTVTVRQEILSFIEQEVSTEAAAYHWTLSGVN
jgi:hypothetical protein